MTDDNSFTEQPESSQPEPGRLHATPLLRPNGQLFELPPRFRWEVTRRHCYYVALREDAMRHRNGEKADGPFDSLLSQMASNILTGIGASGPLPDPSTDFETLSCDETAPFQMTGSVQAVTLRSLAVLLLNTLPKAELEIVGHFFRTALLDDNAFEGDDEHRTLQRASATDLLDRVPGDGLNSIPITPLFHVWVGASGRTITADLDSLLPQWRARLGLPERRVPVQRLDDYLRVWDLREGWTGSGYDRDAEQTLTAIARRLKASRSTILSRYKAAFGMITGHEFTPRRWFKTFGLFKLGRSLVASADRCDAPKRRTDDLPPRPVPEAVISPAKSPLDDEAEGGHEAGFIEGLSAAYGQDHIGEAELHMDITDLISRGLSDEAIARKLELGSVEGVRYLRERMSEF